MEHTKTLIVGAGVSGLAAAAALGGEDYVLLEGANEIGGYCRTVVRDGFVWDYSGHFFHFRDPEIERWLRARMPDDDVRTVLKRSFIEFRGALVDFPFQRNIHQLPREDFIDCLHDLYFASESSGGEVGATQDLRSVLYARYGRGICEKFLFPYNEKLYACDLATLDRDAMGRFFPRASLSDVIRNMKTPDNGSYNATFTYPAGGAIQFVRAIASEVRAERIACDEPLVRLDLARRQAVTTKREIGYEHMISSIPLVHLAAMAGLGDGGGAFSWNKVLVFNLGFDGKGPRDVHWIYFPERSFPFYRVGFYDNILDGDRMSLYVEIGLGRNDTADVEQLLAATLRGLRAARILTDQRLVAWHKVMLDPAYVHITPGGIAQRERTLAALRQHHVHSIGRYGGWTYCSIEDNIIEARRTVQELGR